MGPQKSKALNGFRQRRATIHFYPLLLLQCSVVNAIIQLNPNQEFLTVLTWNFIYKSETFNKSSVQPYGAKVISDCLFPYLYLMLFVYVFSQKEPQKRNRLQDKEPSFTFQLTFKPSKMRIYVRVQGGPTMGPSMSLYCSVYCSVVQYSVVKCRAKYSWYP